MGIVRVRHTALALAATLPLVVSLTACTSGGTVSDQAVDGGPAANSSGQNTSPGGQGSGGGVLPFGQGQLGANPEPSAPSGADTGGVPGGGSEADTGGLDSNTGNTSSGSDVVRFGPHDLSDVDWRVLCSTDEDTSITGMDEASLAELNPDDIGPTFWLSGDEDGKLTLATISEGDGGAVFYYSRVSDGGDYRIEIDGSHVSVSGTGSDVLGNESWKFDVRVTCDSNY